MFVVKACQGDRRTYRFWIEKRAPSVVFEATSTFYAVAEDTGNKKSLYAMLGVQESFFCDPLGEYLTRRFKGLIKNVATIFVCRLNLMASWLAVN